MSAVLLKKAGRVLSRRCDAWLGRLRALGPVLDAMASRPPELHLELTNVCNADCVFCPYGQQSRAHQFMSEDVFLRALGDFIAEGGGDVSFTPIVGDALIHPRFLDWVRVAAAEERVDGIKVVTNAILLGRHGVREVVDSGLTELFVSTAGFDEAMYRRVYRNGNYRRMRRNVLDLLEANRAAAHPLRVTIGLRSDRPLRDVMKDDDFQAILEHEPDIDFTWSFTSAGGRITRDALPDAMRMRAAPAKVEPCVTTFNGPMVLADGTVLACSCVAAMDALDDLRIGHLDDASLGDLWRSARTQELRASFGSPTEANGEPLNDTCAGCDMYRDLELYRTREGRRRARDSRDRARGEVVRRRRPEVPTT